MTHASNPRLSRRRLLELGGGLTAGALGAGALIQSLRAPGSAAAHGGESVPPSRNTVTVQKALVGTDGWGFIPGPEQIGTDGKLYFPDDMAPAPQNLYMYGFRDVTQAHLDWVAAPKDNPTAGDAADLARQKIWELKGLAQMSSHIMAYDEGDQVEITLYNLGWLQRPDIPDGHTVHWHGFKNATPWFDGVPEMSGAAPQNKTFTYFYDCTVPGTYMYHCHWEDVEHIQMGMTGSVWIRPKQNKGVGTTIPVGTYVYNDGVAPTDPKSTAYDREFSFMLMDFDMQQHQKLSHIQQPDWSEYHANAWTINGRSYPDSIKPNCADLSGVDFGGGVDMGGDTIAGLATRTTLNPATDRITIVPKKLPVPAWVSGMLVGNVATVTITVNASVTASDATTFTLAGSAADIAFLLASGSADFTVGGKTGSASSFQPVSPTSLIATVDVPNAPIGPVALTPTPPAVTITANSGSAFTVDGPPNVIGALKGGQSFTLLDPQIAYQPYTSLITCNVGEKVLLRIACLGYQDHSLTMDGIALKVVGRDADWLEDNIYTTDTIDVSPGESYDAIFTAPAHSGGVGPDIYMFYDRDFANDGSGGGTVYTGIATQVRVYPSGIAAQDPAIPNDLGGITAQLVS